LRFWREQTFEYRWDKISQPRNTEMFGLIARAARAPKGFWLLFGVASFHSIISFAYFKPRSPILLMLAIFASISVLYFFWQMRNWARIVIILTALMDFVIDIPRLTRSAEMMQIVIGIRLASAVALLIWLNIQPVRECFSSSRKRMEDR
jgi:hypothetical protein